MFTTPLRLETAPPRCASALIRALFCLLIISLCFCGTVSATETTEYTVYLNTAGVSGAVSGDGTYAVGTTVTITATPDAGNCFYMWGGGTGATLADYTEETTTFTMPESDVTITANFRAHSESWGFTEEEHYKTCLFCGEVAGTRAAHSYSSDSDLECDCGWTREAHSHSYNGATCTIKGTCSCGEEGDIDSSNHVNTYWVPLDYYHRERCLDCDTALTDLEHHIYDNNEDVLCDICGYEREASHGDAHIWSESWTSNEAYHWHQCTADGVCDLAIENRNGYAAHSFTDKAKPIDGNVHAKKCNVCNRAVEQEPHNFDTVVPEGADSHRISCSECGGSKLDTHVFADNSDTTCNTCGYEREVIPKTTPNFEDVRNGDVIFTPSEGLVLPEDAVLVVEPHTPSVEELDFVALEEAPALNVVETLSDVPVIPQEFEDGTLYGPGGKEYTFYEKLILNGGEYYVNGAHADGRLLLFDKNGDEYWYDGKTLVQTDTVEKVIVPDNEFISINGVVYQIIGKWGGKYALWLDGEPAGTYDLLLETFVYINEEYTPDKVKIRQQNANNIGTVTIGENPVEGLESGKTYDVSVIGSNDISVPGAENVSGTITQTFAVPETLVGNEDVVYTAIHKTANGNEIGDITLSEDGKTLTATYTVSSFSPFTVYAFVESEESAAESPAPILGLILGGLAAGAVLRRR